jgi:hypothetical protein
VVALAMVVALGSTIVWGISLQGTSPIPFWSQGNALATQSIAWEFDIVTLMAISTFVAARSAVGVYRSRAAVA